MSHPMIPQGPMAPQQGTRDSAGYLQLGGGYDAARQQAGQTPQQMTQLGLPTPVNNPAPQLPTDSVSPLAGLPPFMQPQVQQQAPQAPQQQFAQYPAVPQQQIPQPGTQLPVPTANLDTRLQGPNIPPELQGRTMGEVVQMMSGLRQLHLNSMAAPQQPQAPAQRPTQSQPQPPAPAQGPAAGTPNQFNWRQPEASISAVVDEKLGGAIQNLQQTIQQSLAPLTVQGNIAAAQTARNIAAAQIPGFASVEADVIRNLQGINPQALQQPETWMVAARMALGDRAIQAQRGGAPQQQFGAFPAQQVPPGQSPMPNLNGFFTEQPNVGGPNGIGGPQLSQAQVNAAAAMGMNLQDYIAWGAGVGGQR